ncbi:MAG: DNA replication/repair protein RecF [Spirochaetaceae bacterium]
MGFRRIRHYNFRNLSNAQIDVDAPEVFLVGENGQGKTNLIESIYVLCYGTSFRTRRENEICRTGEDEVAVAGEASSSEGEVQRIKYVWQRGKKQIELNESPVRDRKELVELLPCIPFAHDDINFVQGPPEMQRFFFDQTLSLYDPYFIDVLRSYRRVLRQRNAVLKSQEFELLPVYDEHLAAHGIAVQERRAEASNRFSSTFSTLFSEVSGLPGTLEIVYRPSWRRPTGAPGGKSGGRSGAGAFDDPGVAGNHVDWTAAGNTPTAEAVHNELERRREHDQYMRTTTSGPHRDRFLFLWGGEDFTRIASTGQVRLASLLLRVAQAQFFSVQTDRKAVLLLDDVLLELDPTRRARFLDVLPAYEQAFFTFLPDEHFTRFRKADTLLYRVENGSVMPYEESR